MKLLSFPILSLITDSSVYQNKEKMVNNITQTTKVGVNMVQIREKNISNEEKKKLIQKIIVKTDNKPIIIINDGYELCKVFDIDGIHLPEKKINQIKKNESPPKVIKKLFSKEEINKFLKLYNELPTTVHNKKQNVIKKRWLVDYGKDLEALFHSKVKNEILKKFYRSYSKSIPQIGKFIVGKSEPYEYLINSIEEFHSQEKFFELIKKQNFINVSCRNLSGGIVAIHSAWKV